MEEIALPRFQKLNRQNVLRKRESTESLTHVCLKSFGYKLDRDRFCFGFQGNLAVQSFTLLLSGEVFFDFLHRRR